MKTSELTGHALDWAVAMCAGLSHKLHGHIPYSTDWAQGGPIIEREKIELKYLGYDNPPYWGAIKFHPASYDRKGAVGPTPLIAAMRCYVASKLGEIVEVPSELFKEETYV